MHDLITNSAARGAIEKLSSKSHSPRLQMDIRSHWYLCKRQASPSQRDPVDFTLTSQWIGYGVQAKAIAQ